MPSGNSKKDESDFSAIPELPQRSDRVFVSSTEWWDNAILHFFHDNWALYSDGYKEAADIIVAHVESLRSFSPDHLVYPVVFLYRQYLELAIKDLIRQSRKLLDINDPFPKIHRIDDLWKVCNEHLKSIAPGDSDEELINVGKLIAEFCKFDPTSEAFRYPEAKNGKVSLQELKEVSLRNVKNVVAKIANILDGADALIAEYLAIKRSI